MTPIQASLVLSLALVPFAAAPLSAEPPASPAQQEASAEPDWFSIVGPFPQQGTPEAQAEPPVLTWLQMSRTADDVARVQSEGTVSLGCWADLFTPGFSVAAHPLTSALLTQAREDLRPILGMLRNTYQRPYPSQVIPSLAPVAPVGPGLAMPGASPSSYPSAHATLGAIYAQILHQFVPEARTGIVERGGLLGTDRVLGGVHWPSDVAAGQRLGRAFATWWINNHRDQIIATCQAEWHGSGSVARN